MIDPDIIAKLERILTLQDRAATDGEAEAAVAAAARLMTRYNINQAALDEHRNARQDYVLEYVQTPATWRRRIFQACASACLAVGFGYGPFRDGQSAVAGTQSAVDQTITMYHRIIDIVDDLVARNRSSYVILSRSGANQFRNGAAIGFATAIRLEREREARSTNQSALVVRHDAKVSAFVEGAVGKIEETRSSVRTDTAMFYRGYTEGAAIRTRDAID